MDRTRLECFVALAEELHFHRAAARCHISQPAISQQLRKLEAELGVQLISRTRRQVSLNPAGEAFLGEARKILKQMDEAAHLARRVDAGESGYLRVAVTPPALYVVLPEIVRDFMNRVPGVNLNIQELTTSQQEEALRAGEIEVGIVHPPLEDRKLDCKVIAMPPFKIAAPAGHWVARQQSVRLDQLASESFVVFPRELAPQLHDEIVALCTTAGFSLKVVQEASPAQSLIGFVCTGVGLAFIASAVQQLARPGVVYVPIAGPRPVLRLGVATRADSTSRAVLEFRRSAVTAGRGVDAPPSTQP